MTDPQAQIDAQERQILSLRAQLAESKTREANLRRMNDSNQNMIGLLKAQLKRAKNTEAERVFGGQG